ADAIHVAEVGIAAGFTPGSAEVQHASFLVDVINRSDYPVAFRDLILHRAGLRVVEIKVIPAVALGRPDPLAAVVDGARDEDRGVDEELRAALLALFFNGDSRRAGRRIHFVDADAGVPAIDLAVLEPAAV